MRLPDHDTLAALARHDPAAFEARRAALIEACIGGAPVASQAALRTLQAQIEGLRALSATAEDALEELSLLMLSTLSRTKALCQEVVERLPVAPGRPADAAPLPDADGHS
jgi:hypothetical protein